MMDFKQGTHLVNSVGRRIVVIGPPGAGKSTLSLWLSRKTGIEVCHLDRLWWKPGWQESTEDLFDKKLDEVLKLGRWIIDGNYQRTLQRRVDSSDTVIWLDFGRYTCIIRVLKRIVKFKMGQRRPDITEGCDERLDIEFMKWIWNYPERERSTTARIIKNSGEDRKILIFRNQREVTRFMESLDLK